MWEAVADCIRRSAKETLGLSRGGGIRMEGAWWWNEEVKEKVKAKKEAYAEFMGSSSEEERAKEDWTQGSQEGSQKGGGRSKESGV